MMKLAASEARNATASATSCGFPNLVLCHPPGAFPIHVGNDDVCPLAGQRKCDGLAYAPGGTSYDSHFTCESHAFPFSLL
jgi:hypothetical protein